MKRSLIPWTVTLLLLAGCGGPAPPPVREPPQRAPTAEDRKPPDKHAEISYDTPRDRQFAEFVARTAGGMVDKVAVGLEHKSTMRVQLGEAAAPEDTLPLTKSLLAGARKDFPGKPITLAVYDPAGEAVLKAHYRPEDGVRYEVVRDGPGAAPKQAGPASDGRAEPGGLAGSGTTREDRKFADWAMNKGQRYLRYVQADLEKHGRLWFGVTREVQPDDVAELTRSLLEGAHKEFPRRELTAAVFDPEGERIGKATLGSDGKVHWSR